MHFFPRFSQVYLGTIARDRRNRRPGVGRYLLRARLPSGGRQNGRISRQSYTAHPTPGSPGQTLTPISAASPSATFCHVPSLSHGSDLYTVATSTRIEPYSSLFTFARAPKPRPVTFPQLILLFFSFFQFARDITF